MKRLSYTLSTLALAVASPAMADISAAEVWADWQALSAHSGQTVTADVVETDTGLILNNFTAILSQDTEDLDFRGEIEEVQLVENGDGTVTMTFSQPYTMTVRFDNGDDGFSVLFNHENMSIVASGTLAERTYTYRADEITGTIGEITGDPNEAPEIDLDLTLTDFDTTYTLIGTDPTDTRAISDSALSAMTMALEVRGPVSEPGTFKIGMQVSDLASSAAGTLFGMDTMAATGEVWPDGTELNADATYGPFGIEMQFESPDEAFAGLYSNDGGTFTIGITPDGMIYEIAATGARAMVTGSEIPVPVEVSTASSEIAFSIPLYASDAPADMGLRLSVQDLIVGDAVLGMVDPGQAIPRDPASLLFDATGQIQLFVDLMNLDPEQMTGPPGELRAITVNELSLSVGGAELAGTADLTFAPNQLIPMPVGQADLQLSGGNALMNALVAGGLVPPAQSGMILGMANVFARPGAGPDTLETTVEFGANGSITANGIPLQ